MNIFDDETMTESGDNFTNDILKDGIIRRLSRRSDRVDFARSSWKHHYEDGKIDPKVQDYKYKINKFKIRINGKNKYIKKAVF